MFTKKSQASSPTMEGASVQPAEGSTDGVDGDVATFLSNLADAMRAAASREHLRISESAEQRRQARIQSLDARAASEVDELRSVAEEDIKGIYAWAEAEMAGLRAHRDERIAARHAELESRLEQHRSRTEREIEVIDEAISAYRADLDRFFERLQAEVDPLAIARHAGARPRLPDLDRLNSEEKSASPAVARFVGDEARSTASGRGREAPSSASTKSDEDVRMVGVMGIPPAAEATETSSGRLRAERLIGTLLGRETKDADRSDTDS
jgi:hypothetical protein